MPSSSFADYYAFIIFAAAIRPPYAYVDIAAAFSPADMLLFICLIVHIAVY